LLRIGNIHSGTLVKADKLVLDYKTVVNVFMEERADTYETKPYCYLRLSESIYTQRFCNHDLSAFDMISNKEICSFSENGVICVEVVVTEHLDAQIWRIKIDPKKTTNREPLALHQIPIPEPIVTEFTLSTISSNSQRLLDYSKAFQQLYDESNDLKKLLSNYSEITQWLINGLNYFNEQLKCPETQQWWLSNLDLLEMDNQLLFEHSKFLQLTDQPKALSLLFESYSTAIQKLNGKSHNLRLLLRDCSAVAQQSVNPNGDLKILLDEYSAAIKLINDTDNFQILLGKYSTAIELIKNTDNFQILIDECSEVDLTDEYSEVENLDDPLMIIEKIQEFINTIQPVLLSLWNLQSVVNEQIKKFQIIIQKLLEKCLAALREANSID